MYHPTRGGVRGGRDQFNWDDVKVDKDRENYLGHSLKAPVGRWQKGKDLHWYTRDKNSGTSAADALKEEIQRIKEEEEQAMREALGLAPKRSTRPQGNKLDKHEFAELMKRGSTAEDLGAGHADATRVDGLGFSKAPRPWEDPSTLPSNTNEVAAPEPVKVATPDPTTKDAEEEDKSEDESSRKKRRREEKKHERHEKRRSRDSDDRRKHSSEDRKGDSSDRRKHTAEDRSKGDSDNRKKHRKDRERRRHDSD